VNISIFKKGAKMGRIYKRQEVGTVSKVSKVDYLFRKKAKLRYLRSEFTDCITQDRGIIVDVWYSF
jgi:hypothetical protein